MPEFAALSPLRAPLRHPVAPAMPLVPSAAMRPPILVGLAVAAACTPTSDPTDPTANTTLASTGDLSTTGADPTPTTSDDPTPTTSASTTSTTTADPPPPEQGLRGEYFATYIDPVLTRTDPGLDLVWAAAAPDPALPPDRFSARWTGTLQAPTTATYQLILDSDDGVRVWLGDELVIDDWHGHFVTRNQVAVDLDAATPLSLRIDYFEIDLDASIRLLWASDTLPEQPIPASALQAAPASLPLPPPKPPYSNPVLPFDCPDPGVLTLSDTDHYAVCTGGSFPIRHSRDLVLWSDTGAAILPDGKPTWAANGNRNWAPELHQRNDRYLAYFTSVDANNVLSVGVAHADSPLGPYAETEGPLVQHPLGVIDASFIVDDDTPYLLYKIDGNSQGQPTPILARQLAPDGLHFADGSSETQLLVNDKNTWEGGVIEAPWLVHRDDYYYLLYSGNVYDHRYRTGVARSPALLGPYEKLGAPLLTNNDHWVGPGHGSLVRVANLDYFVYHAWKNAGDGTQNQDAGRQILVDRVRWNDGWPTIHDGSPSRSEQRWPGVP